jgi:hypothetical protein
LALKDLNLFSNFPVFEDYGAPICSETDPELFFPREPLEGIRSVNEVYENEAAAKSMCSQCPYRMQCLEAAIVDPETQGIWGGTTQLERRKMLRAAKTRLKLSMIK